MPCRDRAIAPGRQVIVFIFASMLLPLVAVMSAKADGGLVRRGEVGRGELLFKGDQPGFYAAAPLVASHVEIDIAGPVARAKVTQRFENDSDEWVEGIYVFPLPETAAVDRLRLQIGDRFIEGRIAEREQARKVYEKAKATGRKAGLVEQQRPNMFTTNVANIGPHEAVVVEIEYQQAVRLDSGLFRLRFPTVVAPRYMPAPLKTTDLRETVVYDPVPDRAEIDPPNSIPGLGPVNPISLIVRLDAGFPLGRIESPHHAVDIDRDGDGRARVTLARGVAPANRDFELIWGPVAGTAPHVTLFREEVGGDQHLLLTVVPPSAPPVERLPREVVMVIDVSGSMAGPSIRQARQSLIIALNGLTGADSFNIIAFQSQPRAMFEGPRMATPPTLARARAWVRNLDSGGGTEMLSALDLALNPSLPLPNSEAKLRQLVFITDGSIGNEQELLTVIRQDLGDRRLFTLGIGSAPNSYFMREAARIGRGDFVYIGEPGQLRERMGELMAKLERPVLTDIRISWPDGQMVSAWPDPLPDLYYGQPLTVTAKLAEARGRLRLSGNLGGRTWQLAVDLATARPGTGVAALWARNMIAAAEDDRDRGADPAAVRLRILSLALEHQLVSAFTSLVAVDVTPSRPAGAGLSSREVPVMFPQGWVWNKVFGKVKTRSRADAGPVNLAANFAAVPISGMAIRLPNTATPAAWRLTIGLILLLSGLAMAVGLRWRGR